MPKKLIIGNWKMAPETLGEAQGILESISGHLESAGAVQPYSLVLCPPFVFVEEIAKLLNTTSLGQHVFLGAQDIATEDAGAFTGEVAGPMLAKLGARYVIVGHSERRWKLNEPSEVVNAKIKAALRNDLTPIVCLGERARDAGFKDFLRTQTEQTFAGLTELEKSKCVIAYEPVWAISTTPGARPDTPESALESINFIRQLVADAKVLYGGSVDSENVMEFLGNSGIDGVLIGGASVKREEFVKILTLAAKLP